MAFVPERRVPACLPTPVRTYGDVSRTTNVVGIQPTGEVLDVKGESQLPYLLGNLSLLPIENLPGDQRDQWTVRVASGVAESGGRRTGPRFLSNDEKYTTATEETTYKVSDRSASEIAVAKTYNFSSRDNIDGKPRFEVSGNGTLTLDANDGLPKSLTYQQIVTTRKNNVTQTIPVKIVYRRLTADEIAAVHQKWQDDLEAAKTRLAKQKENRSKPLTQEERSQILDDLQSDNVALMMRSLLKLNRRSATKDDHEMVGAIKTLIDHKNSGVRRSAAEAWAKWCIEHE